MPATHFLLIEQPRIAEAPRSTMLMPAADLAQQFSEADRAILALGHKVQVGAVTYTDLLAFHDHRKDIDRAENESQAATQRRCKALQDEFEAANPHVRASRPPAGRVAAVPHTPPPPKPNR